MSEKADISKFKVLVIDDELFMLDVIIRSLRGLGVSDAVKAGNCGEAVGLIIRDNLKFDCIIADFNMKPVNGLQFLQKIRSRQEPRIPPEQIFIMLTGNARSEVVQSSVALDVNAYLVKPVAAAKLKDALERAVSVQWKLRSPQYYEAVNIQVTEIFNDAEDKQRSAAAVLPPSSIYKPAETFLARKKVEPGAAPQSASEARPEKEPIVSLRRCSLTKLREKMVLGEDIAGEDGSILVGRGTTLTAKMVDRLRTALADRKFVLIEKRL